MLRNAVYEVVIRSYDTGQVVFEPKTRDALLVLEAYHEAYHATSTCQLMDEGLVVDSQDARLVTDALDADHFEYAIHPTDLEDLAELFAI